MSLGKSKDVVFNDGEGIDYIDFNNLQRYAFARESDMYFAGLARSSFSQIGPSADFVFSQGIQGAGIPTGVALTTGCNAGVLYKRISTSATDGTDAKFIPYYLEGNEFTNALSPGDATDDRIDVVAIKFEYENAADVTRDFKDATTGVITSTTMPKQRNVKVSVLVYEGTPAPTPSYPTITDSGYVRWFAVRVPAMHVGVLTDDMFEDHRMPLGITIVDVPAQHCNRITSEWTDIPLGALAAAGGMSRAMTACVPQSRWNSARLIRLGLVSDIVAASTGEVNIQSLDMVGLTYSNILDVSSVLHDPGGGIKYREYDLLSGDIPYWLTGLRNGGAPSYIDPLGDQTALPKLAVELVSGTSTDTYYWIRFVIAGNV